MKKKHDIEYCGFICRYNDLIACKHPDIIFKFIFNDKDLSRDFPDWCPLENAEQSETKIIETGISLNPEQKRLIDEFVSYQCFDGYIEHQIIELIERCIYADREVTNENNE